MEPIDKLLNYLKGNHTWTRIYKPNELTDPIAKAIKESGDKTAKQLEDVFSKLSGIKGEKGEKGDNGINGKDGKDGIDGKNGLPGKDGKNGFNGKNGKDGYTPVKGVDYFDGKDGIDGKNGIDGVDGYSPVKGKDYFTKKEIKSIIDEASKKAQVAKQTVYSLWQRAIGVRNLDDVDLTAPTNGQALTYSNGKWINSTVSGGSGTPGGSDTQVQFNDGGSFGGDAGLTYNKTTDTLTAGQIIDSGLTASQILATDASKQLTSLSTVTYPSLTELSYVKGLTSAVQTQLNSKAADTDVVHDTGDETIAGVKTFSSDPIIPDEAYGAGWNGSLEPATKNAIYDKIETLSGGHDAVTVTDSAEIDFTLTGQNITASLVAGSIDETKLDASVNASLDLADTALQSANISDTAYDATTWDGVTTVAPSKNAVRDKIETLQPLDSELTALAGLTSAANKVPMFSGSGTATLLDFKDEDNMASDSATAVPSQQSVKAYADTMLPKAGGTMTGNITLGENTSIDLDPAGSADGKYSGIAITGTAGEALSFGDVIVLDVTAGKWFKGSVSAASGADGDLRGMVGMCVLAAAGDASATKILLQGMCRADANFPALTVGAAVYATTTGDITLTQPTTTDHIIRVLGFAMTADEIYFNPSQNYITHV